MLRQILLGAAILALPVAAHAQPGPSGPPAVGVVKVSQQPITETNEFVGRVQAVNRVDLVARVTGFLEKRLFTEGSEVKAGDMLYQIEKPSYEADVQAKAASVGQANAVLQNATITLGRANSLLNTPAGQRSTVDDATATQRSQAAQLASAQAQLRNSQINLAYTDIHAPIDGKISRTAVTEGNVVGPTTGTLATIVSQDPMYVLFPISVRTALDLRDRYADKGGAAAVVVKLKLPNGKTYDQTGRIDYIDPAVAPNTDTLNVRAVVPNPVKSGMKQGDQGDRDLTDGMFLTVLVEAVQPVEALAIPQASVLSDQQGSYVWVVADNNTAQRRPVTLGQPAGVMATVTAGLKVGETVVADGVQRVRPGQPVNPAPAAPGPGGAGGPPGGSPGGPPGGTPASGSGTAPSAASPQPAPSGGAGQGRN